MFARLIGSHTKNSSLATAVVIDIPRTATRIVIQASGQNVRYTLDGTTPTATLGYRLSSLDVTPRTINVEGEYILTVIEEASGGIINYHFERLEGR